MDIRENIKQMTDNISMKNQSISLLIVEPTNYLIDKVVSFARLNPDRSVNLLFFKNSYSNIKEENTTIVIPKYDLFSSFFSFEQFIDYVKPILFRSEIERFLLTPEELGIDTGIIEDFDKYVKIELRTSVYMLQDLNTREGEFFL